MGCFLTLNLAYGLLPSGCIEEHHAGNDTQCTHKNSPQSSHQPSTCSALLGLCGVGFFITREGPQGRLL